MANCIQCGATIPTAASVNNAPPTPSSPVQTPPVYTQTATPYYPNAGEPAPGSKYELISTKGLIGIMFLMVIPVVGGDITANGTSPSRIMMVSLPSTT